MPNNASARRGKDKKNKDKKKETDPKPLHKEDKASQDSSSLSPSIAEKDEASLDKSSLSLSSEGVRTRADSLDVDRASEAPSPDGACSEHHDAGEDRSAQGISGGDSKDQSISVKGRTQLSPY